MAALKISRKHRPRRNQPYDLLTWGQIKTLTNQVKNLMSQQEMPQSPKNLPIAMLTCRNPPPPRLLTAQARLTNQTCHLAGFTYPTPFITVHKMDQWKDEWLHPYAPSLEPSHPGEEGKLINISLGLPLCQGPGELCINVSDKLGLSSCLQTKTFGHCCPFSVCEPCLLLKL